MKTSSILTAFKIVYLVLVVLAAGVVLAVRAVFLLGRGVVHWFVERALDVRSMVRFILAAHRILKRRRAGRRKPRAGETVH